MELVEVKPEEYGVKENEAVSLTDELNVYLQKRNALMADYNRIVNQEVTDEVIEEATELYKKLVKFRTQGIDVWHREAKAYYRAVGEFLDAVKRKALAVNKEMEDNLKERKDHYDNLAKEKAEKLKKERIEAITPFIESEDDLAGVDLGAMTADIWDMFLAGKKQSFEKKQEEERLAEEKRKEEERLRQLQNDRKDKLIPVWNFLESVPEDLSKMSEEEFTDLYKQGKDKKHVDDAEKEKLRKQAEKVKERNNKMKSLWQFTDVDSVDDLSDKEFETVVKNAEAEQDKAIKEAEVIQTRREKVNKLEGHFEGDYENMSDKEFNKALKEANSKKTKTDEVERRERVLKPYWSYVNIDDIINLSKTEFEKAVIKAKRLKDEDNKRKAEIAKQEEEKKKLASASDQKKILAFTKSLLELEIPVVKEQKSLKVLSNVKKLLEKIDNYAREQY